MMMLSWTLPVVVVVVVVEEEKLTKSICIRRPPGTKSESESDHELDNILAAAAFALAHSRARL